MSLTSQSHKPEQAFRIPWPGVWVQGREAEVLYAGSAPGKVSGIMQVRIRLPLDIPSDPRVPSAMMLANRTPSQDGVTMAVA